MQAHQRQSETAFVAVIRSSVSSGLRAIKRPQTRAIKLRQHDAAAILRVATAIQQFHSSELSCCTFSLRVRARAPCKHGPLNLNGRRASRLTLKYAAQCYSQRPERVEPALQARPKLGVISCPSSRTPSQPQIVWRRIGTSRRNQTEISTILALLLCCLEINKYLNPSRTVAAMASGWDLHHPHAVDATRVPLRTY